MKNRITRYLTGIALLCPLYSYASVETMMSNLQSTILNVLAPIICICGLVFSGFKMALGDESGKKMLFWSCIGTAVTFTAPSLLSFLQNRVAA